MILKFFLLFNYLNMALLIFEKRQKVLKNTSLIYTKAVKIFEYEKIMIITRIKLNYISKL